MTTSASPPQQFIELQSELRVPVEHPCLAGHFPGRPIVPAVVLLDLVTSELLSQLQKHSSKSSACQWRLLRIVAARFQSPWLPDESLRTTLRTDMTTHRTLLHAFVGERAVATATLQLALVDADSGTSAS